MARNIDIFATKARGQYIYNQYQSAEWLKAYSKFIDGYIQETYFDKLKEMWDTIDVGTSLHEYLTFYTKWYFGLFRPLGGASISDYFDIGLLYDNGRIFDDAQDANGLITGEQYLKYIKFIYDYTYETWHIDYILAFIADYCDISPTDIFLNYDFKEECRILIPASEKAQDFVKLVINYYDEMCLPFSNIINFLIMSDTDEAWRGIMYTPYTEVKSLKEWYSPLEKYKQKNSNYVVDYKLNDKFWGALLDAKWKPKIDSYLVFYQGLYGDYKFYTSKELATELDKTLDEVNESIEANVTDALLYKVTEVSEVESENGEITSVESVYYNLPENELIAYANVVGGDTQTKIIAYIEKQKVEVSENPSLYTRNENVRGDSTAYLVEYTKDKTPYCIETESANDYKWQYLKDVNDLSKVSSAQCRYAVTTQVEVEGGEVS